MAAAARLRPASASTHDLHGCTRPRPCRRCYWCTSMRTSASISALWRSICGRRPCDTGAAGVAAAGRSLVDVTARRRLPRSIQPNAKRAEGCNEPICGVGRSRGRGGGGPHRGGERWRCWKLGVHRQWLDASHGGLELSDGEVERMRTKLQPFEEIDRRGFEHWELEGKVPEFERRPCQRLWPWEARGGRSCSRSPTAATAWRATSPAARRGGSSLLFTSAGFCLQPRGDSMLRSSIDSVMTGCVPVRLLPGVHAGGAVPVAQAGAGPQERQRQRWGPSPGVLRQRQRWGPSPAAVPRTAQRPTMCWKGGWTSRRSRATSSVRRSQRLRSGVAGRRSSVRRSQRLSSGVAWLRQQPLGFRKKINWSKYRYLKRCFNQSPASALSGQDMNRAILR